MGLRTSGLLKKRGDKLVFDYKMYSTDTHNVSTSEIAIQADLNTLPIQLINVYTVVSFKQCIRVM